MNQKPGILKSHSTLPVDTNSPRPANTAPGMPMPSKLNLGFGSQNVRNQTTRPSPSGHAEQGRSNTPAPIATNQQQIYKSDKRPLDFQRGRQASKQDEITEPKVDLTHDADKKNIWAEQMHYSTSLRRGQAGRFASSQDVDNGQVGLPDGPMKTRGGGQPQLPENAEVGITAQGEGFQGDFFPTQAISVAQYTGHGERQDDDVGMSQHDFEPSEMQQAGHFENGPHYEVTEVREPTHSRAPSTFHSNGGNPAYSRRPQAGNDAVFVNEGYQRSARLQQHQRVVPQSIPTSLSIDQVTQGHSEDHHDVEQSGEPHAMDEGSPQYESDNEDDAMAAHPQMPRVPMPQDVRTTSRMPHHHLTHAPQQPSRLRETHAPSGHHYEAQHHAAVDSNPQYVSPELSVHPGPVYYADEPMYPELDESPQHQSYGQNDQYSAMAPRGGGQLRGGNMGSQGPVRNQSLKGVKVNRAIMPPKPLFDRAPPFKNPFTLFGKLDLNGIHERCAIAAQQYNAEMTWELINENNADIFEKCLQHKSKMNDIIASKDKAIQQKKIMTEKYRRAGSALKSQATSLQSRTKQYSTSAGKRKIETY